MSSTIILGLNLHIRANALPAEREIHVTAKKFQFTPDTITLKKGEPVVLVISSGSQHGFNLRRVWDSRRRQPGRDRPDPVHSQQDRQIHFLL